MYVSYDQAPILVHKVITFNKYIQVHLGDSEKEGLGDTAFQL